MRIQLLSTVLLWDTNGQNQAIARLSARAKESDDRSSYLYRNYLEQLERAMVAQTDNPELVLQSLNQQLESAGNQGYREIWIPNLVGQVGEEKAAAFLRRALTKFDVTLQFNDAGETITLAQMLALELMDQLKTPQWGLINSHDTVKLYEAMDKHFGRATNDTTRGSESTPPAPPNPALPDLANLAEGYDSSGRPQAQTYFLLGLVTKGRTAEAVALAKKINSASSDFRFEEAFTETAQAGYADALDNFFHDLLAQDPTLPYWGQYLKLAVQAGQTGRMVALVRTSLARPELSVSRQARLHEVLFQALLAADQVEAAVAESSQWTDPDTEAATGNNSHFDDLNPGQLGAFSPVLGFCNKDRNGPKKALVLQKNGWSGRPANEMIGPPGRPRGRWWGFCPG